MKVFLVYLFVQSKVKFDINNLPLSELDTTEERDLHAQLPGPLSVVSHLQIF